VFQLKGHLDDLEAFKAKLLEEFAEGVHEGQRASAGVR
jgi:hypothetical protein